MASFLDLERTNPLPIGASLMLNHRASQILTRELGERGELQDGDVGEYRGLDRRPRRSSERLLFWEAEAGRPDHRLVKFKVKRQWVTFSIHEGVDYWKEQT